MVVMRPAHAPIMSALFAGPFDGCCARLGPPLFGNMIRAQNRLGVGTCHHSVGDGFVPCEFGVPARALMIGAYAVRPTVTASPCSLTGKRGVSAHGVGREERGVEGAFFSQPSRGNFAFAGKRGRTAVGGGPGARSMGMQ